jgi:hypothetical protein
MPSIIFSNGSTEQTLELEEFMTEEDVIQSCLVLLNKNPKLNIELFKKTTWIKELVNLPKFLNKDWDNLEEILGWAEVILEVEAEGGKLGDFRVRPFLLFQEYENLRDYSSIKEQFDDRFQGFYFKLEDYIYEYYEICYSEFIDALNQSNLQAYFDWKGLAEDLDGEDFYSIESCGGFYIFSNC